jgi:hypothetical protein
MSYYNLGLRLILTLSMLASVIYAQENLATKVVRMPLNQNEPAIVKIGLQGITTLEFPTRIEAIDGYGFSINPVPDGPDLFQISFNKGTNFLSLKAMREGVKGNLTVVLEGKAYALFCEEFTDPAFVVIFESGVGKHPNDPKQMLASAKEASPARLLGFLDKIKGFPSLKVSAPEIFQSMDVAEPDSDSSLEGLKVTLRRVIRDNALDSVGFEIELVNKGESDFLYDPESFGVRVGEEAYPQSVSDASGLVPAGKAQTAFFVVTGTAAGGRNDLAVTNKFAVMMRQIKGEMDPHRKVSAEWQEPPNKMPVAETAASQEPQLPEDDSKAVKDQPKSHAAKHPRKGNTEKSKSQASLSKDHSLQGSNKGSLGLRDE